MNDDERRRPPIALRPLLRRGHHRDLRGDDGAGAVDVMMGESKLVDIAVEIQGETERAYRLFDGAVLEWIPKSQCQNNKDGTFTMPVWMAKERGFV